MIGHGAQLNEEGYLNNYLMWLIYLLTIVSDMKNRANLWTNIEKRRLWPTAANGSATMVGMQNPLKHILCLPIFQFY